MMYLAALDSISAILVVGDWSGVSCFNINITRKERSIDYAGFPVRMKQVLLRELEWLEGLVQCVTGSMTSCLQYRCYLSNHQ